MPNKMLIDATHPEETRVVVVRGNRVEGNVAGIEIENSTDADVYDNDVTGNTGGVLVFNLPGPPVQDGRRTRIFNNRIYENNEPNFGAPGSSVSGVPKGTGAIRRLRPVTSQT